MKLVDIVRVERMRLSTGEDSRILLIAMFLSQFGDPYSRTSAHVSYTCIAWDAGSNVRVQQEAEVLLPHDMLVIQPGTLLSISSEAVSVGCFRSVVCYRHDGFSLRTELLMMPTILRDIYKRAIDVSLGVGMGVSALVPEEHDAKASSQRSKGGVEVQ